MLYMYNKQRFLKTVEYQEDYNHLPSLFCAECSYALCCRHSLTFSCRLSLSSQLTAAGCFQIYWWGGGRMGVTHIQYQQNITTLPCCFCLIPFIQAVESTLSLPPLPSQWWNNLLCHFDVYPVNVHIRDVPGLSWIGSGGKREWWGSWVEGIENLFWHSWALNNS